MYIEVSYNGVDTIRAPGSLTSKESMEAIEVDLASMAEKDGVLIAVLTRLGRTTLFLIEVDSDTGLVAAQVLAGPCKLVAIVDPKLLGFAQSGLDALGLEDLLEEDALGVILGIACEGDIVLVNDGVGCLQDVEGVQGNAALFTVGVEILGALRKGVGNGNLVIKVNTDVCMTRTVERDVLVEAWSTIWGSHNDKKGENTWEYR
jgi:hypothetical protein